MNLTRILICVLTPGIAFAGLSIAPGGCTVVPDGMHITCPISGVSGSLLPLSGITGFQVVDTQLGTHGREVASTATALGSVVTLTLSEPVNIPADDLIVVSLSGGNLTDTGGDVPIGQTGISVTNNSEFYGPGGATFLASGRIYGGYSPAAWPFLSAQWDSSDGQLAFNACATAIDARVFQWNSHYVLTQDGVTVHDWGPGSPLTIWSNLGVVSVSGCHQFSIVQINPAAGYQALWISGVRITGTLGGQPAAAPVVAECGDSLVALGGAQAVTDSRLGHMWLSSFPLGLADQHSGWSGYTVTGAGMLSPLCPSTFTAQGGPVALAYLRGGGNDIVTGADLGTFRASWDSMISATQSLPQPPQKIVVLGIPSGISFTDSARAPYNGVISASATAHSVCFADTSFWLGPSEDRQTDGIHFNALGEGVYADYLIPITSGQVRGSSFSVSGPSTGTTGAASTPFVVSLPSGAHWHGETVTPSDGAGGTFSPVSANPNGVNSVSFVYTPSSAGTKTISVSTTGQCWVNAPGASYISTTAGGGGGTTTTQFPISISLPVTGTGYISVTISGTLTIVR